jgi:lipoprotein-releasing system permease protein
MDPDRRQEPSPPGPRAALGDAVTFEGLPGVRPGSPLLAELWIALRHLMSKKSDVMISIVAVLAVLGVVGSVALVNVVTSVMTGFEVDLRSKILGANAHVVVLGVGGQLRDVDGVMEQVEKTPGVKGAAPFVYTEMVLRSGSKHAGVILKGIDPERTDTVTSLMDDLKVGPAGALETEQARADLFRGMAEATPGPTVPDVVALRMLDGGDDLLFPTGALAPEEPLGTDPDEPGLEGLERDPSGGDGAPDPALGDAGDGAADADPQAAAPPDAEPLPGILIGEELALTLQVGPGSELQLMDPFGGAPGPMGLPMPRIKRVRVAGVYESGMYEYDNKWTYMANADVQEFLRMGDAVTGVEVSVDDIYGAPDLARELDASLGPLHYARNWQQMNQGLFDALKLERRVSSLVLFSTVVIAALLIVCVLTMMVLTKGREIAILRAMGASRWGVLRIFVFEGTLIGFVGAIGGTALGLLACWLLDLYGWPLDTDVYFLNTLPVVIEWDNVVGIAVGAVLTCFAATLYPAISAAMLEPVEGLRYE